MMLAKLLLTGALQGAWLWGLWQARELKTWPATDPLSERALLYVGLALPLAIYLTHNIATLSKQRRLVILMLVGTLFPLLGAYSGWAENTAVNIDFLDKLPPARPTDLLAAGILGFMLVPLLIHFDPSRRAWDYTALFETAWRNAMLCLSSAFLTAVFWGVLFAGAELLHLIGLNAVRKLIEKPMFSIPVTGMVFGSAFSLSLMRAEMVVTLRRFSLSLLVWLLPLLLAFVVIWAIAVPFTGIESLLSTRNAAFILLWITALAITFANAAYQDGNTGPPYGKTFGRLLAWCWLGLPVVVAIAWWAMSLRIVQHGWTEDRVWGVFVLAMATLYVTGYALSSLQRSGWLNSIGNTNTWVAVVICLGLLALLSPIADARRIAVSSQMERLLKQTMASRQFDFEYLRWEAGRYGKNALHTLAAGITHQEREVIASKAKQALNQKSRYLPGEGAGALSTAEIRQRIRVLPRTAVLDDRLLKALLLQQSNGLALNECLFTNGQCTVWLVDLNADQTAEAVVLMNNQWGTAASIRVLQNHGGEYRAAGFIPLPHNLKYDVLLQKIEQGAFNIVAPAWNEIELSGQRLQLIQSTSHYLIIESPEPGSPPMPASGQ